MSLDVVFWFLKKNLVFQQYLIQAGFLRDELLYCSLVQQKDFHYECIHLV